MLIECKLKRKGGSKVSFDAWPSDNLPDAPEAPAAEYHFKPIPVEGESQDVWPHIANVTNEHHIARLLGIPSAYRAVLQDGELKRPALAAKPAAKKAPIAVPKKPETKVSEILDLPVRELKAKINTYSEEDLREALAAEQAKTEDKPRTSWCEVIQSHLGPAEAEAA